MVWFTIAITHKDKMPRIAKEPVNLQIFTGNKFLPIINMVMFTHPNVKCIFICSPFVYSLTTPWLDTASSLKKLGLFRSKSFVQLLQHTQYLLEEAIQDAWGISFKKNILVFPGILLLVKNFNVSDLNFWTLMFPHYHKIIVFKRQLRVT